LGVRGVFTSFLSSSSSPLAPTINHALHTDGHLLVKPTFQLITNPNVFAAGDVVAIPEQHSLVKIHAHEPIAVANILAVLKEKEAETKPNTGTALKEYKGATEGLVITNGRVSFLLISVSEDQTLKPGFSVSRNLILGLLYFLWVSRHARGLGE
jgi:NADH dehydrogenase FAD-containing subunit